MGQYGFYEVNRVTAIYRYLGRNNEGNSVKGLYKADSESDVAAMLRARGIYPVTIKEEETGDIVDILMNLTKKAKLKDLAVYCRQFSAIISAGIPIVKALGILQRQAVSPALAAATQNVKDDIVGGLRGVTSRPRSLNISLIDFTRYRKFSEEIAPSFIFSIISSSTFRILPKDILCQTSYAFSKSS
jgi:hypothetical protein